MKGLHLKSLTIKLEKVGVEFVANPAQTIENVDGKITSKIPYIKNRLDFFKQYTQFSLEDFTYFTFEDLCKLRFSSSTMMDNSVEKVFERQPEFEVIRKIKSSWWRWGGGRGDWNELVDVYNGIKSFSLGLPAGFDIRLDYTTGYNEFGYSKFSRIYLDGVFAYFVYHKGVHVMTVGFSVMENRRLLIQQVQLTQPAGNRWLFKLPKPRMELVIDAFARSFPGFSLYVIDGQSLMRKILTSYQNSLQRVIDFLQRHDESSSGLFSESYVNLRREELATTKARIAHVESETPRLTQFYANCGTYRLGTQLLVNRILHRKLE